MPARRDHPAQAETVADFYKGKTVSLIAGFPPGGGYDTYVRVLARHYGRFIPGQPSVVASNMPGAGSLTAANHIYNKAHAGRPVARRCSPPRPRWNRFSATRRRCSRTRNSAGSAACRSDVAYCGVWQSPGVPATFDEMLTKQTIFGGGAAAAITFQHPMVLKNVLHANIRVIPGYAGTRDINLAMQRGEVNGTCGMFGSSIKSRSPSDVKDGRLKVVIQMGNKKSSEFGEVPSVFDYAKTDEDRAVLDVHFGQLLLGRPLAGPPGIPADRLQALRDALAATVKDKEFLAEANKIGLDIDPATPGRSRGACSSASRHSRRRSSSMRRPPSVADRSAVGDQSLRRPKTARRR